MTRQFLAALVATVAVPALLSPTAARAEFYVGFGVGGARVEANPADLGVLPAGSGPGGPDEDEIAADRAQVTDFSGSDVATQFVVGWRARYFGFEAGYVNFNQMSRSEAEDKYVLPVPPPQQAVSAPTDREWTIGYSADGYQATVLGFLPVTDTIELFGKVGAIIWESEQTGKEDVKNLVPTYEGNTPVSAKDDGTDLTFGVGALFRTDSPFSVRVQADYYDIANTDQIVMFTVSAFYSFGKRAGSD